MKFEQPASHRPRVGAFEAQFDSEGECGHDLHEGELIGYLPGDSQPSCGDCVDEYNEGENG